MEIPILYEDNDCLVISKPAGLVVHADGKTKEPSVAEWVAEKFPETKGVGEPLKLSDGRIIDRPGIVHRLDRETSGVLLIAKNQEAFQKFKEQFQDRDIGKIYNAFLYGELEPTQGMGEGVIDRPIGRSKSDFRKWSAQRGARGEMREAVTKYKILEKNGGFTFIEVYPETGRTHQIRVHFKAVNHPVVCDSLYAPKREPALGFSRLALHARSLTFTDLSGKSITVEAPFPEDFRAGIAKIKAL
jgi:23S rRNA pseudouridine1911/1915/1917 synthase